MKITKFIWVAVFALMISIAPSVVDAFGYGDFGSYYYDNVGSMDKFTNKVDGYSINIPTGMSVDMSKSEVVTTLYKKDFILEIYTQSMTDGSSAQSYINYGNAFIKNTVDHKKEHEGNTTINGKKAHVLKWSREKLSKVKEDYNYYATVDIVINNTNVVTLFFKSTKPLNNVVDYLAVSRSYKTEQKTVAVTPWKTNVVENTSWSENTAEFFKANFLDSQKTQWGIFEPYFPNTEKLKSIENSIGSDLNYVVLYTHIKDNDLTYIEAALDVAKKEGRTIELTLQTRGNAVGEKNAVYGVLNGDYDTYLLTYASQLASYDEPVLFRLGNEMNGDWCSYSAYHTSKDAAMYKEMYKYIYNIFEEFGANKNIIWVWNPNGRSYPNFDWNNEMMYYPGDEYVDVVGMTAYNTGTYYSAEKWTSFNDLYKTLYSDYTRKYSQPLMITEFASSSVGGDKVLWVEEMFASLVNYPKIKIAIWWNGADYDSKGKVARPYYIDDIPGVISTFRKNLANK